MTTDEAAPAEAPRPPGTFAPLAVPAYRKVWSAAVVSNLGTFLQLTAGPWLMNELTGSPLLVALVTSALTLPRLLLTLPAGALADAFDRRNLMIAGNVIGAVATGVMAALAFAGAIEPISLLALTFALGVGSAVSLPAAQTLVPDLVPAPLRAHAITLNSAAFNVARAVGPSVGGLLVAAGLTAASFGINAVTFVLVIGVLLSFPRQPAEDEARGHLLRAAALGVRYVRFTPAIRVLVVLSGGFVLTATSVQTLLPSVASDDLGLGAGGFGLLYGLFGAGALVGVVLRDRGRRRLGAWMLPGSIVGFGLAGVAFGLSPTPVTAGLALTVCGVGWSWTLITLNASIQTLAPRWVRSRVVSLYLLAIGLQPIGAVVAGLLAERFGPGTGVAVLTGVTVLLGLLALRLDLPVLGEIVEPTQPDDLAVPQHATTVAGSPVIVATTWEVDPARVQEFLADVRVLRGTRFRTGAHRWSLYRDADRPYRITEFFAVHDWDEHLAQHARFDEEAAAVVARLRAFDVTDDGPVTRHLAGLDILDANAPAIEDQLLTVHSALHAADGSIPLDRRGEQDTVAGDADPRSST